MRRKMKKVLYLAVSLVSWAICPTEHVFSTSKLQSHSTTSSPNNVYTYICKEVFNLNQITYIHSHVISVVPTKSILKYGSVSSDNISLVQVSFPILQAGLCLMLFMILTSALCNGVTYTVSPYVTLSTSNNTDVNMQYHDFRAFTADSRLDWYFESMTLMRWNTRVGFLGYTPKELKNLANSGHSVGVYNELIYDITNYITNSPGIGQPMNALAPSGIDPYFM